MEACCYYAGHTQQQTWCNGSSWKYQGLSTGTSSDVKRDRWEPHRTSAKAYGVVQAVGLTGWSKSCISLRIIGLCRTWLWHCRATMHARQHGELHGPLQGRAACSPVGPSTQKGYFFLGFYISGKRQISRETRRSGLCPSASFIEAKIV